MRRFMFAAAAIAALAGAGLLAGSRAEAMPLAGGLTGPAPSVEQVYLRCTRVWNGWNWVRRCVDVGPGPGYYGYGPGYGYGYYGGWRPRPRYYGYY